MPFDADQAALSFQNYRKSEGVKVLAALTPREVLQEYESAFQGAGYEPGFVLPATLAALNGVEADRPTLLVKADGNFISVAIADKNEVIFYRMLDVIAGRTGTAIADEVYPSIVFFEDNYSAKIERILLSSVSEVEELTRALEEQTGVRPETLDAGAHAGESLSGDGLPDSALAGVAGALTSLSGRTPVLPKLGLGACFHNPTYRLPDIRFDSAPFQLGTAVGSGARGRSQVGGAQKRGSTSSADSFSA